MTFLKGHKTYVIAALMVAVAVVRLLTGEIALTDLLNSPDLILLLQGLGLAALRAGVTKP